MSAGKHIQAILFAAIAVCAPLLAQAASVEVDLDAIATPVSPRIRQPAAALPTAAPARASSEQEAALSAPAVAGPNADALFVMAYGHERGGRPLEAEARYRQLLAVFPNSDAAPLAAERLEVLRQAAAAALPPIIAPVRPKVCTLQTMFANDSGWCGRVQATRQGVADVEVNEVRAHGFLVFGLRPSPCTGNRWLDQMAVGAVITVPESCLGAAR